MRNRIGAERGWGPTSRVEFDREIEAGSLYVGTPETVAQKIAATSSALGLTRFDMKYSAGTLAHEKMMRSIELYGREVIPRVRELLAAEEPELADEGAELAR
jgi:alkanesulfonate monooxygenase SsuD/methylene tetrahydromethanopterin reductase-like flavin-dependent oxidoreductase (luciferase family)